MTIEEIRELIQLFSETGIAELEVQRGENRVRIRRAMLPSTQEIVLASPASAAMPVQVAGPSASASLASERSAQEPAPSEAVYVKSPIVGTFYESAAPGSPPFVQVGDIVHPGQILCIIESMKLMNEIEAEIGGTIVSKLVENGRPVEYGEALFAVNPR